MLEAYYIKESCHPPPERARNRLNVLTTSKKLAFTLAEVLITLAVIGIVAAMTIPTILNKYQEHVMVQKYKKIYSLLNNALLQQYAEKGAYYECSYGSAADTAVKNSDCIAMYEDMKRILKTAKICDNNAYENGCIPDYKGFDTIDKEQNLHPDEPDWVASNYSGFCESRIKDANKQAWILNDGTIIMFYLPHWGFRYIAVDLNGMQVPNKWGHDLFTLKLADLTKLNKNVQYFYPSNLVPEDGGMTPDQIHEKAGLSKRPFDTNSQLRR